MLSCVWHDVSLSEERRSECRLQGIAWLCFLQDVSLECGGGRFPQEAIVSLECGGEWEGTGRTWLGTQNSNKDEGLHAGPGGRGD